MGTNEHNPEVIPAGEEPSLANDIDTDADLDTRMLTSKQDQSVISDLVAFSKEAKLLDRQRRNLKLIGPHAKTNIRSSDKPEIQILKELGKMYNDMNLEDQLAEEAHIEKLEREGKDFHDDPFFLDPDRIKDKRQHLEAMARNLKLISDHTQKIHNTDGKLLQTLIEYRKNSADIEARTIAQQQALNAENEAVDNALGEKSTDDLSHKELLAEAEELGLDLDAILNAKQKDQVKNAEPE